jgi:polysaccharide export outer membrane protein
MQRINVNLKEIFATSYPESGKDVPLMDGDIVVVPGLNGELYQFMSAADREVIVVGEVGSPGIVNFSAGELRTLMRAIFKAGSFTQFAKKTAVKVIRYDPDRTRREMQVDVEAIMEEGELHKDIELQPGDMVIVPEKKINL